MMPFYSANDWEQSSSPMVSRAAHLEANDTTALLWPVGGTFDTLTDGEHPVLAIGRAANRPANAVGVVMTYNSDVEIAQMNVADKIVVRAYVANIAGYALGDANAWQNTIYPGDPVYVDDSDDLSTLNTGCTLSFSTLNEDAAANPLAGYVWWCQDEYADSGVGGPNSTQGIDQPAEADTSEYLTLCVMLVNDHGNAAAA
jgi:hypothetical protein